MKKLKLDIQRFAPDPPVAGNLIDENCMYEYDTKIKQHISDKTGTLSNLTTTAQSNLVAAINEVDAKTGDEMNYMSIGLSANKAVSTGSSTYGHVKIALDQLKRSSGTKLTFDSGNNAIKIGEGVNFISVSSNSLFTMGASTAQNAYVGINKNGVPITSCYVRTSSTTFYNAVNPSLIIPVQKDDLITLSCGSSAASQTITFSSGYFTQLNVYVVEDYTTVVEEEDSGWQNITLPSGITAATLGGTPQCRKIGNHVFVRGGYAGNKGSSGLQLGTLPTGWKPQSQLYWLCGGSGARVYRVFINTSGEIWLEWIYGFGSGTAITGSFTWVDFEADFWTD